MSKSLSLQENFSTWRSFRIKLFPAAPRSGGQGALQGLDNNINGNSVENYYRTSLFVSTVCFFILLHPRSVHVTLHLSDSYSLGLNVYSVLN